VYDRSIRCDCKCERTHMDVTFIYTDLCTEIWPDTVNMERQFLNEIIDSWIESHILAQETFHDVASTIFVLTDEPFITFARVVFADRFDVVTVEPGSAHTNSKRAGNSRDGSKKERMILWNSTFRLESLKALDLFACLIFKISPADGLHDPKLDYPYHFRYRRLFVPVTYDDDETDASVRILVRGMTEKTDRIQTVDPRAMLAIASSIATVHISNNVRYLLMLRVGDPHRYTWIVMFFSSFVHLGL